MKIAFVHFCRLASERVPYKPVRMVGGETLLEITVKKGLIGDHWIITPDEELGKGLTRHWILSEGKGRIWPELIQPHIEHFRSYDWIIDCNFICHPFLSESSIDRIVHLCSHLTFPFTLVKEERGVIWNHDRELIVGQGELPDTKNNPIYLTPAHIAYCYRFKDLSLGEKELSERVVPVPFQLSKLEQIDIDTEEDLELANLIWLGRNA